MVRYDKYILAAMLSVLCTAACTENGMDTEVALSQENVIKVGGIDAESLGISSSVTKAETYDAESVDWLLPSLKSGLDITFGKTGAPESERVAILSLVTESDGSVKRDPDSGFAEYTFLYRESDGSASTPAKWVGNGNHYFRGVNVPERIRFSSSINELSQDRVVDEKQVAKVDAFTTNQSKEDTSSEENSYGNYTLLTHYLSMPANTNIAATVGRVKLPFSHRLSRVIAYILIDPSLDTQIKGYKKDGAGNAVDYEDPATSSIKFCNVDVLAGVHDVYNASTKLHTLTPEWAEGVRKVIPHYMGEESQIIIFEKKKQLIHEGSELFESICSLYDNAIASGKTVEQAQEACGGYTKFVYNAAPVYDLVVRPTYTSYETVMYDEYGYANETTRRQIAAKKNVIDFEIGLENGLTYDRHFEFDLDANYMTKVYLRVTAEGIDYNESGSSIWMEQRHTDDYYGVNNQNGNTMSLAGTSWQRAYRSYTFSGKDSITDGHQYNTDTEDVGQYVGVNEWIKAFSQAYEGGKHHGDYFILDSDVTIDATMLPDDFVFTGHIDAFSPKDRKAHTITLTNLGTPWTEYVETVDYSVTPLYSSQSGAVFSLPELYTMTKAAEYYSESDLTEIDGKTYVTSTLGPDQDVCYTQDEIDAAEEGDDAFGKTTDDVKTPAHSVVTPESVQANVGDVKSEAEYSLAEGLSVQSVSEGTYYTKDAQNKYSVYILPTLYKAVDHVSGNSLFAGLDGVYTTRQEKEQALGNPIYGVSWEWEANVHRSEKGYWLPYKDSDTNTGWRAEALNLIVMGADLFAPGAVITGNVQNCKDGLD
ncbi:MAG: hypothetical protein MJZ16_09785, partial [Bacteroidales bacterium]|nr:hypothetical protein [Bacteroidales bacterium]